MRKSLGLFLIFVLFLVACGKKSEDALLASAKGVEIKAVALERIFNNLQEQDKARLASNKYEMDNFVKNTAAQLASIDLIAINAEGTGIKDSKEFTDRVSLGKQEVLIRTYVNEKFLGKDENISNETLQEEYEKIKASLTEEQLKNYPEFEAVKARIKQQLANQKVQQEFQAFVSPLANKVKVNEENLQKICDDFWAGNDLDKEMVISEVDESAVKVSDLLLSLGELSLDDVRAQVKDKADAEQFFRRSAENLGINIQLGKIAKDEGFAKKDKYKEDIQDLDKIILVNLYLSKEIFSTINVSDEDVKAEYDNLKKSNKKIEPLDKIFDQVKIRVVAMVREKLVMEYLNSMKKDITIYEGAINDFVYQHVNDEVKAQIDSEKKNAEKEEVVESEEETKTESE